MKFRRIIIFIFLGWLGAVSLLIGLAQEIAPVSGSDFGSVVQSGDATPTPVAAADTTSATATSETAAVSVTSVAALTSAIPEAAVTSTTPAPVITLGPVTPDTTAATDTPAAVIATPESTAEAPDTTSAPATPDTSSLAAVTPEPAATTVIPATETIPAPAPTPDAASVTPSATSVPATPETVTANGAPAVAMPSVVPESRTDVKSDEPSDKTKTLSAFDIDRKPNGNGKSRANAVTSDSVKDEKKAEGKGSSSWFSWFKSKSKVDGAKTTASSEEKKPEPTPVAVVETAVPKPSSKAELSMASTPTPVTTAGSNVEAGGTASDQKLLAKTGARSTKSAAVSTNVPIEEKELTPEELIAAQEEVRRQAKEVEALKNLDLAYQAMSRNEFEPALKYFSHALDVMPRRPNTVETRQRAMTSQADCEYRIALNYYKNGRMTEAKEAVKRALGYSPTYAKTLKLNDRIKSDEVDRAKSDAQPVPPYKSEDHIEKEKRLRSILDRGRQYIAIKEYEKARVEFINVLIEDSTNVEASDNLKLIAQKQFEVDTGQMERFQKEMVAKVRDTWTPPTKTPPSTPKEKGTTDSSTMTGPGKRKLLEKLNGIMIPELSFRDANIVDVIRYLVQQSEASDKDSAPNEKGVNIILNLKRPGGAEAAAAPAAATTMAADPFSAEPAVAAAASPGSANIPKVTLSLRNISLMDAIKFITEVTGLKQRLEENVVIITPADMPVGEFVTKTYKVQPTIGETISSAASSGGGTAVPSLSGEVSTTGGTDANAGVKKFFIDAGVSFPEGSSVAYRPSLNLLIVKNTSDNLEMFERILNTLNVVPVQVEIEARFVEVGQENLEELGLEWLLKDNWELAMNSSAKAPVPIGGRERIQVDKGNPSKGLRNLDKSGVNPGGTLGNILSVSSILTNPELTMILHALEQETGNNLLSAPKVTTKTGANAEIKVVRELIYPTEYLVQAQTTASTGAGGVQSTRYTVVPSSFQTRDVGVILNVTPTVGPDGFTIDLTMLPQVVELVEWVDYGYDYPMDNADNTMQHVAQNQPVFHTRSITTSISIWDGQTVVMGGLITEAQLNTLDKVPILADIPLIGNLFKSTSKRSVKKNLLIFVTANLVDPAGNKINKDVIATAAGTSGNVSKQGAATP